MCARGLAGGPSRLRVTRLSKRGADTGHTPHTTHTTHSAHPETAEPLLNFKFEICELKTLRLLRGRVRRSVYVLYNSLQGRQGHPVFDAQRPRHVEQLGVELWPSSVGTDARGVVRRRVVRPATAHLFEVGGDLETLELARLTPRRHPARARLHDERRSLHVLHVRAAPREGRRVDAAQRFGARLDRLDRKLSEPAA